MAEPYLTNLIFTQFLWFAELKLEPVLQTNLHIPGNVAAKRPWDVWKPEDYLHRWNIWANEIELSILYGGEGAYNFTHWGFVVLTFFTDSINFFQDVTFYNAYEKDIAIVNIFFGEPTVYGESTFVCY